MQHDAKGNQKKDGVLGKLQTKLNKKNRAQCIMETDLQTLNRKYQNDKRTHKGLYNIKALESFIDSGKFLWSVMIKISYTVLYYTVAYQVFLTMSYFILNYVVYHARLKYRPINVTFQNESDKYYKRFHNQVQKQLHQEANNVNAEDIIRLQNNTQ